MAIFNRIRRKANNDRITSSEPSQTTLSGRDLPQVNQRVSVSFEGSIPVPSRVEDTDGELVTLAAPALALSAGDQVNVAWELADSWCSFTTTVAEIDRGAPVPYLKITTNGQLTKNSNRRGDERYSFASEIELRSIRTRAIRAGRELNTRTTEVSENAVRFVSSAPFAPGDVLESRIKVASEDFVGARIRIIRVDQTGGSWRSTITAVFDEILRSDRARLLDIASRNGQPLPPARVETASPDADVLLTPISAPTTLDNVGGRDEPVALSTFENVVEWLRKR